jgi:hypothetical protein
LQLTMPRVPAAAASSPRSLLIMIAVMIVRDILVPMERHHPGHLRRDTAFPVRYRELALSGENPVNRAKPAFLRSQNATPPDFHRLAV